MSTSSVARRYAKGLFGMAAERDRIERWSESLIALQRTISVSPELADVFSNPAYSSAQRRGVIGKLCDALSFDVEPANLLHLLAERGRLDYLAAIVENFGVLADEALGRVRAKVVSAVPLDSATLGEINSKLAATTQAKVFIEQVNDPSLLGGIVTQVGSTVYDGSIRTQLEELRRSLKR